MNEWNETEPEAIQTKYYVCGVGNVRVGWSGDAGNQETLELTKVIHLAATLAEVPAYALELELHA